MHYKTIILELIRQNRELHGALKKSGFLAIHHRSSLSQSIPHIHELFRVSKHFREEPGKGFPRVTNGSDFVERPTGVNP